MINILIFLKLKAPIILLTGRLQRKVSWTAPSSRSTVLILAFTATSYKTTQNRAMRTKNILQFLSPRRMPGGWYSNTSVWIETTQEFGWNENSDILYPSHLIRYFQSHFLGSKAGVFVIYIYNATFSFIK